MDKLKQESFFQLLQSTYESTADRDDVSLEDLMTTLKDQLSILFAEKN